MHEPTLHILINECLGINSDYIPTSVTQKNCFRIVCVIMSGLIVGGDKNCRGFGLRPNKNMRARHVTGFYVFFSPWKWGNSLHIWGRFLYSMTQRTWRERKQIHCRKFKNIQWRKFPEIADFRRLSWSNVS